ncbi:MAG TPA: MarR family EPS-associated transcriptional regulator [Syntrophorhabdaceae bacterium]|nr:MarR family EPS-associated transcriptional regulator [Syntrophorhabdaceae bacterium]
MNEIEFKALRELSNNNQLSQRELSQRMGISLGRVNYVIRRLMEKGYIKAMRFKNSRNKLAYLYVLTPKGIDERINLTKAFLKKTYEEYTALQEEIERLERERRHGG